MGCGCPKQQLAPLHHNTCSHHFSFFFCLFPADHLVLCLSSLADLDEWMSSRLPSRGHSSPPSGTCSKHGSRSRGQCRPAGHRHPHQRGPKCQNCVDAYPTFLAVLWTAGLLCSQVPAAFAGLMYLFVRQKYFVGYLGERTQSTPGYIFGKRIILFLFLMSLAGILNYCLILLFGSDFENYIKTISTTISPLLLIP
uniref:Arachidonate 5-lipoxygenase-activating protein n=1 Tax=Oryctolagus cuniculus TaxID=9986 RepID=A0A5F9CGD5_RABIT